ncbi:MAG: nicotianamine synthase family protein [Thermoplasmatota archaeon]
MKKTTIIDKCTIFVIRLVSNYFWVIVDILSHDNPKIALRYEQSIGKEYKKECAEIGLSKGKKVLHVGCGSYPLTELSLSGFSDVKITGIDKNEKAVERAKQIIKDKNIEEKIKIELGNGTQYKVDDFDLIIISSCAIPKKDILQHIFSQAKKDCIIILRDFDVATDLFISWLQSFDNITIEKRNYHPVPTFLPIGWNTFYLKKNK